MAVSTPSTGLSALDQILHGIRPGDNVVWQVDSIDDYLPFVEPFVTGAQSEGRKIIYFRFAKHKKLVSKDSEIEIYQLNPEAGFEIFITKIHQVIEQTGRDAYYVFDSLSELAIECFSERMLGNFFRLTCPYLYELDTVAYFAVLRNYHSYHAALPISETTQLLLDIYRYEDKIYVYPLKVQGRHSSTMFMLHVWDGDEFKPVTESTTISNILTSTPWPGLQSASYRMVGMWDRRFMQAEELLQSYNSGECSARTVDKMFHRQLTQLISRDERILTLAGKYLSLSDLIYFWKRLIGSGMIGGKAVGMLLARAVLKKTNPRLSKLLESVDSFFIGSDIFYSFLVENGCWSVRQNQKNPDTLLDGAEEARQRILEGDFPDYIVKRFSDMLNYFGQSPVIVRSSSLLEDNFGNAFSGKYETVFCTNQGTLQKRLEEFINAVRFIYASSMSEKALAYRAQRSVLDQDEQMALLVQRVSGRPYGKFFLPHLAGVGLSYNPYVWDEGINPEAGALRLVFGLGTRAVNRSDDDYTRLVALNAPGKYPQAGFDEVARYAQKKVDILDLDENFLTSSYFTDIVEQSKELPVELFASIDREMERSLKNKRAARPWVLTFDKIFSGTTFIEDMREMLEILKKAYGSHVDIEFTANFLDKCTYKINLLQCRPLQIEKEISIELPTISIQKDNLILQAKSGIIGRSKRLSIDRIIYVEPLAYGNLPERDRYSVARLIGKLTHLEENAKAKSIMLLGPGRWGTSTPSLGVPISFAEINTVSVLCEIDIMREGLTADLSLGTHFFGDLVEMGILYIGFFSNKKENVLNKEFLNHSKNYLKEVLPKASQWSQVIRVIEASDEQKILLSADVMKQNAVLYIDNKQS